MVSTAWCWPDGTPHPSRGGVGAGSVTFITHRPRFNTVLHGWIWASTHLAARCPHGLNRMVLAGWHSPPLLLGEGQRVGSAELSITPSLTHLASPPRCGPSDPTPNPSPKRRGGERLARCPLLVAARCPHGLNRMALNRMALNRMALSRMALPTPQGAG